MEKYGNFTPSFSHRIRQGAVHTPLFPLLPPTHEDIRHLPEILKHIDPCANISYSIPSTEANSLISAISNSRAKTTLFAPCDFANLRP